MIEKYNKEKDFLKKVENPDDETNKREILNKEQIEMLLEKYPKVPQDYISYLQEIGSGNFREGQFKVHSSLFNLEDLGLEDHYELQSNIWFFGDNYCGDFSGFDFNEENGNVVEFWHESGELHYTNTSFQTYIRTQMLMDEKY
ncbi:SMI1/KNR4 family protein [Flavobacterium sp. LC2016-01]|uniref:SMI1/KNR4 family protein n=1 Tax=Flavobacterium sp. LC2016-01 TaxID=2675876 RepID=UPI0012BA58EA|nr:SMI1/KNR4 family protein [Flavobacterium sp. LC2016-01]MTH18000.1 hypothetical protein [Flavobacterium sp. LC2016-01]